MKMKATYLAGAALFSLFSAASAYAQETVTTTADAGGGEIVVFGRGETRQQSSVTADAILNAAPGTSPLKTIERLPGVSFQSADPFGAYEWSARISLRSFNQNQLGFTLDGVPLGDMSYGNYNGLHISRAAISENVARVDVAQGAGALGTASTSNLGGAIQFVQRAPATELGADGSLTYGDNSTVHAFARIDSGELFGENSLRLSGSYAFQDADKWKGIGEQRQHQASASFVQPIPNGEISGFVNWSRRRENDYQDMSLGMLQRLGRTWDNISGNWPLAVQIADIQRNIDQGRPAAQQVIGGPATNPSAGTVFPTPIQTVDDAYFNAAGLRNDTIGALRVQYDVNEHLHVNVTGYRHEDEGQGIWFTPYVATPLGAPDTNGNPITNPAPISVRTTEYTIQRYGFLGSATLDLGPHAITAGFWYENNDFNQARRFYGLSRTSPGRDSLDFQENPFATQWSYAYNTETKQFYLQDVWTVTDALTVNAGFKATDVTNEARAIVIDSAGDKSGSIEANDGFLPQVGFTYDVTRDHQIFGTYAENMRAFVSANTSGPFSTTAAGFAAIRNSLQPETSKTFELGWRFRFGALQGSVAAYHVDFENRLLAVTLGAGIVGNPSALQNVGGVRSQGVEAAAQWRIAQDWTLFGSYSFNDSTYQDNVLNGSGGLVAATSGKNTVDTPENLARAELSYDNGAWFGSIGAAYTGERYFTYLNDQSVDAYTLVDLTLGYRFQNAGALLNGTEVQFNATNIFDEDYVSTLGSNGFGNSGDAQTLLPGAPRQVFVTVRKHF